MPKTFCAVGIYKASSTRGPWSCNTSCYSAQLQRAYFTCPFFAQFNIYRDSSVGLRFALCHRIKLDNLNLIFPNAYGMIRQTSQ